MGNLYIPHVCSERVDTTCVQNEWIIYEYLFLVYQETYQRIFCIFLYFIKRYYVVCFSSPSYITSEKGSTIGIFQIAIITISNYYTIIVYLKRNCQKCESAPRAFFVRIFVSLEITHCISLI